VTCGHLGALSNAGPQFAHNDQLLTVVAGACPSSESCCQKNDTITLRRVVSMPSMLSTRHRNKKKGRKS
jgi:hypothetical protein